ncbi:MAG: ornithine carbamoyltransferase [Armatimonadetes bacterium]|nr:ornithine carbamoyltransferase [Armatimonadota bacterium]
MWQRFTERARKVVFYAQEEAGRLGENYVSTEHLLLGLVRENDSVAARILDRIGVSLGRIRSEIERQVSRGDGRLGQDMQLTPRAKRVIDLAYDEARQLNNNYIGTEHLLLGLIREGEGLAGRVLSKLGVDLDRTRAEVIDLQAGDEKDRESRSLLQRAIAPFQRGREPKPGHVEAESAPIERICQAIIQQAIHEKAGEVLMEPTADNIKVFYRIGGFANETMTMPKHLQEGLVAQFKSMCGLNAAETQKPQLGMVPFHHEEGDYVLRIACTPTEMGEQVTVRISSPPEEAPAASKPSQRMAPPKGPSPIAFILDEHRLRGRDILGIEELTAEEIRLILNVAARLKANKFDATQTQFAQGQTLALLFEKPSLRTRVTFEAGMNQLGGHAIYLEGRLGQRETVPDVARNLDRWLDGIMARTFDHGTVRELAEYANVPVINGLSDREHPCQALADFQTLAERKGELAGLKLAYVGDGNNVAQSLFLLAAKAGTHFTLACPVGYEPDPQLWQTALDAAQETGATLTLTHDPAEGVADADAVYTDVWASMGQEEEAASRSQIFAPFQVNGALMQKAKPDALVMHCLPAHRGEEITDDVIESPHSVVFDQAENRLHAQKAVLALVL